MDHMMDCSPWIKTQSFSCCRGLWVPDVWKRSEARHPDVVHGWRRPDADRPTALRNLHHHHLPHHRAAGQVRIADPAEDADVWTVTLDEIIHLLFSGPSSRIRCWVGGGSVTAWWRRPSSVAAVASWPSCGSRSRYSSPSSSQISVKSSVSSGESALSSSSSFQVEAQVKGRVSRQTTVTSVGPKDRVCFCLSPGLCLIFAMQSEPVSCKTRCVHWPSGFANTNFYRIFFF